MATAVTGGAAFKPPTTAEELLLLPDGMHGEIVHGVFVEMTAPGTLHGVVTMRLGRYLDVFADDHGLGIVTGAETAFCLARNPDTVRCPDSTFVRAERVAAGIPRGAFEGAPDLAVEVLSPSNTRAEIDRKLAEYLRYGARQVWIVDSEARTVATHTAGGLPRFLEGDDVLDGADLLPGFAVGLPRLFPPIAPPADEAGDAGPAGGRAGGP